MDETMVGLVETDRSSEITRKVISAGMLRREGRLAEIFSYFKWVYERRGLIRVVCYSELKQTIIRSKLSYLWWIMDPLFDTLCYVFLVYALGRGAGREIPYPIFILTGIVPWRLGTGCWMGSAKMWQQYKALITQVRFPYMILILSRFLHEFILYLISYVVLFGTCIAYGFYPRMTWTMLPLVILVHGILILTLMFLFSIIGLYFADFERLLPFLLRLWFFSSPALYGLEDLPAWAQNLMLFNPATIVLVNYRGCLLHGQLSDWTYFAAYIVVALLCMMLTISIFIRKEPYITRYV